MARSGGGGGGIFRMDGPFIRIGGLIFDFIFLDIVWLILSGLVPIFIIFTSGWFYNVPAIVTWILIFVLLLHWGPATTAIFYSLGKKQRGTDSYTFRDFWKAYRSEYKQSMLVSLILTTFIGVLVYNVWVILVNASNFGGMVYVILPLEVLLLIVALFISIYIYALLARFELSTKDLFKYSFFMANKFLPYTLICVALLAGCFALLYYVALFLIMILVSVYCYIAAALLERVFRNFMPDEDAVEEDDLDGFNLDAERQAIIDRYMGRASQNPLDEGDVVRVDEKGEVIKEEDYKVVKVEKEEDQ